jgi:hypothetical protein
LQSLCRHLLSSRSSSCQMMGSYGVDKSRSSYPSATSACLQEAISQIENCIRDPYTAPRRFSEHHTNMHLYIHLVNMFTSSFNEVLAHIQCANALHLTVGKTLLQLQNLCLLKPSAVYITLPALQRTTMPHTGAPTRTSIMSITSGRILSTKASRGIAGANSLVPYCQILVGRDSMSSMASDAMVLWHPGAWQCTALMVQTATRRKTSAACWLRPSPT